MSKRRRRTAPGGHHQYSLRLPYNLWSEIKRQAEQLGVSANAFMTEALIMVTIDHEAMYVLERRLRDETER